MLEFVRYAFLSLLSARPWLPALCRVSLCLAILFAIPASGLLLLVWLQLRACLTEDLKLLLQDLNLDYPWPAYLVMAVPLVVVAIRAPFPPDDLLRDLVAYQYDLNYRRMFWGVVPGWMPSFDAWDGFDRLAALEFRLWGDARGNPAALGFQLLATLCLIGATLCACARQLVDRRNGHAWMALVTAIALSIPGVAGRCLQGRPEIFFAIWTLAALSADQSPLRWFTIGIAMIPLYWLAPAYAPAALLLPGVRLRTRYILATAYAAAAGAYWMFESDGQYLTALWDLHLAIGNRLGSIGEDDPIWSVVLAPLATIGLVLMALARHGIRWERDRELLLVLGWFLLPNMVRYAAVIVPLFLALCLRCASTLWADLMAHCAPAARVVTALMALVLLPRAFGSGDAPPALAAYAGIGQNDRVLAPFDSKLYRAIYAAQGRGVFAPPMEFGYARQDVQHAAIDISEGHVDCAWLARNDVRWVVESATSGVTSPCLRLYATDAQTRIWRRSDVPSPAGARS